LTAAAAAAAAAGGKRDKFVCAAKTGRRRAATEISHISGTRPSLYAARALQYNTYIHRTHNNNSNIVSQRFLACPREILPQVMRSMRGD